MPHAEFLRLLQLVDANRKVSGRETLEIKDADVATAQVIDDKASAHEAEAGESGHVSFTCPDCIGVSTDRNLLREKLHSQGQDLPMEVWHDHL